MKYFLKESYKNYYLQTAEGHLETTREVCVARGEEPTPDNQFKQRWLYDVEAGYLMRLMRNKQGEALYRANASDVKREERHHSRRNECVSKEYGCADNCDECQTRTARLLSLDKPIGQGDDGEVYIEVEAPDVFADLEEKEESLLEVAKLHSAISRLDKEQEQIINLHFFKKKTQAEIAVIMDKDQSCVSRQLKTAIKKLKDFFN